MFYNSTSCFGLATNRNKIFMLMKYSTTDTHELQTKQVFRHLQQGMKVCRYNYHSASSMGWPFEMLKYWYIFQIKYMEAILSNSTRKLLRLEISKMLTAFLKNNVIVLFIIIFSTLSFPTFIIET